jgi:hypothetical protein
MENATIIALISVIAAFVTIVGTVITTLFKLLSENTKVTSALVEETKTGNAEAKQRNGHLGEQNIQITELITSQSPILAAIRDSNDRNAKTNAEALKLLKSSADTLVKTETDKTEATAGVKDTLARK